MESLEKLPFQTQHGDYVVLATFDTPTEAHILQGCLEASGIHAVVADGHLVQADSLLTVALGGVRIRVQEKKLAAAKQVLVEFGKGAFELEGDDAPKNPTVPMPENLHIWSPDTAAFWSFVFTPIFGSVMNVLDASRLGNKRLFTLAVFWLITNTVITNYVLWHMALGSNDFERYLDQSTVLVPVCVVWYLFGVRPQSQFLITTFGVNYRRKSINFALMVGASLSLLRFIV